MTDLANIIIYSPMIILCYMRGIYRTLTTSNIYDFTYVSGHDFIEQENGDLVCDMCKKGITFYGKTPE